MLLVRLKLKLSYLQAMKKVTTQNQDTGVYSRHYQNPQHQLLSCGPKATKLHKAVTHFLVVPWQKCNRESARDLPRCCAVLVTCTLLEEKDSSTRCQYFKECNRSFRLGKYFLLYFLWYSLWFKNSPIETSPSNLQPIWSSSWSVHILILRSFHRSNFGWLGF